MIVTVHDRLATERRFLAALFLWPRAVSVQSRDFLAPEHGIIFEAIIQAHALFPAERMLPDNTLAFDDCTLAIVIGLIREYATEHTQILIRAGVIKHDDQRGPQFAAWAEQYITHELMRQPVTPHAIDDLSQFVRECPRCGR